MKLKNTDKNSMIIEYKNTDNVLEDICSIINSAKNYAYQSVNMALVERNWLIGYRIAEEELKGKDRADYGIEIIKKLSKELTKEYGKGFDRSNLYRFLSFYKNFPEIVDSLSRQYYYRLLKSQVKEPVIKEMQEKNKEHYLMNKLEFVKNPVIAEFLGYSLDSEFTETELETSIINNLQKFLMELRKRLCFCSKTATHSYRKRRLLYRFSFLQLYFKMFRIN